MIVSTVTTRALAESWFVFVRPSSSIFTIFLCLSSVLLFVGLSALCWSHTDLKNINFAVLLPLSLPKPHQTSHHHDHQQGDLPASNTTGISNRYKVAKIDTKFLYRFLNICRKDMAASTAAFPVVNPHALQFP